MDMEYIVRSSEGYGYTQDKLRSIVRVDGIRKGERLGKNVPLVFRYIPVRLEYRAGHTTTMIQSMPVPTV